MRRRVHTIGQLYRGPTTLLSLELAWKVWMSKESCEGKQSVSTRTPAPPKQHRLWRTGFLNRSSTSTSSPAIVIWGQSSQGKGRRVYPTGAQNAWNTGTFWRGLSLDFTHHTCDNLEFNRQYHQRSCIMPRMQSDDDLWLTWRSTKDRVLGLTAILICLSITGTDPGSNSGIWRWPSPVI